MYLRIYALYIYVCIISTTGLFGQHPYPVIAFTSSRLVKLARAFDCQSMSLVCLSSVQVNESWEHMSDGVSKQTTPIPFTCVTFTSSWLETD